MKLILSIAALIFLLLSLIPFFQALKRIRSWKDRLDEPVGNEDADFISGRMTVYGLLFAVATFLGILAALWDIILLILT